MSKQKGQSEMIELVIVVVAVLMLIMLVYSFFAGTLNTSSSILTEKHKNDRIKFVCTFLPEITIEGLNRTISEAISLSITTGDYMIYYGRKGAPVNTSIVVSQILDQYLDKGYWKLKITDDMSLGSQIPYGVNPQTCSMSIPLITYKGNVTKIYLYRW